MLSCTLPDNLGAPVFPLPAAAVVGHSPGAGLIAIGCSTGARRMPISLSKRGDANGCPGPAMAVRNADVHQGDASRRGGRVVPVLLRAGGGSVIFASLPLQARDHNRIL